MFATHLPRVATANNLCCGFLSCLVVNSKSTSWHAGLLITPQLSRLPNACRCNATAEVILLHCCPVLLNHIVATPGVRLVHLNTDLNLGPLLESAAAASHVLDKADLSNLAAQGLNRDDSLAALLLEGGDQENALLRAFTYARQPGKLVQVWYNRCLEKGMPTQTEVS